MLLRRLLVVAAAARQAASTPLAPSYTSTWTASRAYSCAEAKEHDEIIFDCGGEFISKVSFASYGTPTGHCGEDNTADFRSTSKCHAMKSEIVLEERCLGQTTCMFVVNDDLFGGDPCVGKQKRLAARLACGDHLAAELAAKAAKGKRSAQSAPAPAPAPTPAPAPAPAPALVTVNLQLAHYVPAHVLRLLLTRRRVGGYGVRFLLLLLVVFLLYCGLGVAYRIRRLKVEPGLDAIPHLEMWKDLPFLVRDGVIFSVDTIKSKARQSYQPVL